MYALIDIIDLQPLAPCPAFFVTKTNFKTICSPRPDDHLCDKSWFSMLMP